MTENSCILAMKITYPINEPKNFSIESNVQPEKHLDLLEEFLRTQIGAGKDFNRPHKRETYQISIELDLQGDIFRAQDDTGNLSLRDGILADICKMLKEKQAQ